MVGRERDGDFAQKFGRRASPKRTPRHVPAHDCSSLDNRALADYNVRENHAMRAYEDVILNDYFAIAFRPFGAPVEMAENRGTEANRTVIADTDVTGVQLINVDELADPDVLAEPGSSKPMQPWPQAAAPGHYEGNFVKEPVEDIAEHSFTSSR
jgi:hypothetical protein